MGECEVAFGLDREVVVAIWVGDEVCFALAGEECGGFGSGVPTQLASLFRNFVGAVVVVDLLPVGTIVEDDGVVSELCG